MMGRKHASLARIGLLGTLVTLALLGASLIRPSASDGAIAHGAVEEAAFSSPFVTSYPLPAEFQIASGQLLEAEDRFWFTASETASNVDAIGSLEIAAGSAYTYTFYPIPTNDSVPYDLAWDGQNIWFTELSGNKLGKLHVANGTFAEYPLETDNSEPTGITWSTDGIIWFVERAGNKLVAFDPATEQFTPYPYTSAGGQLEDVAAHAPKDWIWFTAPGTKRLVQFNTVTKQFLEIPTAAPFISPYTPSQVSVDQGGNPWVSTLNGRIGRYAASTLQYFRWYQVAAEDSKIEGLIWAADGRENHLWFTESNTGFTGQLFTDASGSILKSWRFPVTDANGRLSGLVARTNGAIWLSDGHHHELLRWSPPYAFVTRLPILFNAE